MQALKDVDYDVRYNALLKSIMKYKTTSLKMKWKRSECNKLKRSLYASVELLRLDLQEAIFEKDMKDESIHKQLEALDVCTTELGIIPVPMNRIEKIIMTLQFISLATYFLLAFTCMTLLLPLVFLHPMLRKMSVPNTYLPFDLIACFFSKSLLWILYIQVSLHGEDEGKSKHPVLCMFRQVVFSINSKY